MRLKCRRAYPSDVTDEEWVILEPLIPPAKPGGRPRTVNMREVIDALFYLDRTGAQWRALPHDFPPVVDGLELLPHMAQRWDLGAHPYHVARTGADKARMWSYHVERTWATSADGIDLRGADVRHVNLRHLPLAGLRGSLTKEEWVSATLEQRALAGIHLEQADLSEAYLEGAVLRGTFLQDATLRATRLEQAVLYHAHLEQAYLRHAHLEGANMMYAHLEGTYLRKAWLMGTDLRHATCDNATNLEKVTFRNKQWGCALFADLHWNDCNLTVINWQPVMPLGDEALAQSVSLRREQKRNTTQRQEQIDTYETAVRAYRQLANAMRTQEMNDEADPYAYRAQRLQRAVLWRKVLWATIRTTQTNALPGRNVSILRTLFYRVRSLGAYLFSRFLDGIAG